MRLASLFLSLTVALSLPMQAGATVSAPDPAKSIGSRTVVNNAEVPPLPPVEVTRAEFGMFFPPSSTKKKFVSTRTVRFEPNQAYGWRVYVKPRAGTVRWREEFVLPAAPSTWGGNMAGVKQEVSGDGRTSVKEGVTSTRGGVIFNMWSVADGDPKGDYVIRVFLDDKLVQTFDFKVE